MSVWAVGAFVLAPAMASAQPEALVLLLTAEGQRPRAELVSALRIQLLGVARVDTDGDLPAGTLPLRVRHATQRLAQRGARLAIWTESVDEPEQGDVAEREIVLYVVGEREGRALIEVLRVPLGTGPEADRSVALKVREFFDLVSSERSDLVQGLSAAPELAPSAQPVRFMLETQGALAFARGTSGPAAGFGFSLGGELVHDRLVLFAAFGTRFLLPYDAERDGARVTVSEVQPLLSLGLARELGSLRLGGMLAPSLRFLRAHARSPLGARAMASDRAPALGVLLFAELVLHEALALRLCAGAEWLLLEQRYAVNDALVHDLGPLRGLATGSLVVRF